MGRDFRYNPLQNLLSRFNPRAHVGRDEAVPSFLSHHPRFNPRAHVGRDEFKASNTPAYKRFNPRAHVGRDLIATAIVA